VDDWKSKLEGLNKQLQTKEKAVQDEKAASLAAFRKWLGQIEPVLKNVGMFAEAFGVDCDWGISRFDDRYPYLEFRVRKPLLAYRVLCRDGVLEESIKEGEQPPRQSRTTLEALTNRRFEERLNQWVRAAGEAGRKVPGKRH